MSIGDSSRARNVCERNENFHFASKLRNKSFISFTMMFFRIVARNGDFTETAFFRAFFSATHPRAAIFLPREPRPAVCWQDNRCAHDT